MASKPTPAGHTATANRKHKGVGSKMRMHSTRIDHHHNGGHTVTHQYGPESGPSYMGQKDKSFAFGNTPQMMKHLKTAVGGGVSPAPMAPDVDNDQM